MTPDLIDHSMAEPASKPSVKPAETTSKVVWPTIGATCWGRCVGRLCSVRFGLGSFFTLGKFLAVATIPVSLGVFAWQLLPIVMRRYCLSNRRIVVQKGLTRIEERSIGLDEFDAIDIRVLPGQEWLRTGEMVFSRDGKEVFRLSGVPRPQTFREICLKQRNALPAMRDVGLGRTSESTLPE
jgi:hypothetical protein